MTFGIPKYSIDIFLIEIIAIFVRLLIENIQYKIWTKE